MQERKKYRMEEGVTHQKSYAFAIRIVRMVKYLREEKREHILSKQVLRSGTAIGALVREAEFAQSKADFINKLKVALNPKMSLERICCFVVILIGLLRFLQAYFVLHQFTVARHSSLLHAKIHSAQIHNMLDV